MTDQIDLKVLALITAGTTAVIGIVKKLFPIWTDGKEEGLAQALPIVFMIVAKACGAFHGTDWINSLTIAVAGGLGAGVLHDKVVNPLMKGRSNVK